uniref:Uncharacterized LOC100175581 n=1 Tax=Ciona intestinalis TaxID=7719 RepID=H2XW65_CIOIN|nr:uncharacterized protein LOC100175581 [Ciona intestinalis]|eukprot:XP_026696554.1 uncharacterized protein LOC100175581 [Ciona intestinalis]
MSVQFKARLLPSMFNLEEEIRRFAIGDEQARDFALLKKKIGSVFPTLNHGNFKLYYKDDRDDQISFNSDEELLVALEQMDDGVLSIIIKNTFAETFNFTQGFPAGSYTGQMPTFGNPFAAFTQPDFIPNYMGGQQFGTFQYQYPNGANGYSGTWSTNNNHNQYQAQQQSQSYSRTDNSRPPYRSHR